METICKDCGAVYVIENGDLPTCMSCVCGCIKFKQTSVNKLASKQEA